MLAAAAVLQFSKSNITRASSSYNNARVLLSSHQNVLEFLNIQSISGSSSMLIIDKSNQARGRKKDFESDKYEDELRSLYSCPGAVCIITSTVCIWYQMSNQKKENLPKLLNIDVSR
jgi:hypothetical protein